MVCAVCHSKKASAPMIAEIDCCLVINRPNQGFCSVRLDGAAFGPLLQLRLQLFPLKIFLILARVPCVRHHNFFGERLQLALDDVRREHLFGALERLAQSDRLRLAVTVLEVVLNEVDSGLRHLDRVFLAR